jgi:hypothetical protein
VATTGLTWNPRRQAYLSKGKVVSTRKIIDELVKTSQARMRQWTERMTAGKLSVPKWQILMAREVKNVHLTSAVIAEGGREQMTSAAWGRLGNTLKFQYRHLRDFAGEIPRTISDRANVAARAEMYATSSIGTYENEVLKRNQEFGLQIARRETAGGSDSCDDCLEQEDLGWQPIDEVREIGDSTCGARCNCVIEYETVMPGDEE